MLPPPLRLPLFRNANALLTAGPGRRWCWKLLGAFALLRLALIGAFMLGARFDLTALPNDPFYRSHSCLTAYWRAAALARDGAINLYDPVLYENQNVDGFTTDAFVYPPPFLILPSAAALVTNRFMALRAGWYFIELGLFLFGFGSVAAWIGGRSGAQCLLWLPIVVTGLPVLLGLQMGNFHLAALTLAMLGMLAVEKERPVWGGFCLALATIAKVFPGVLLILLLTRRKKKAIWWALGWFTALTALTFALFGKAPFVSFFEFQLPRMLELESDPWQAPGLFGTVNSGIFGLALKARALGVPIGQGGASILGALYTVAVLAGAVGAGVAMARADAAEKAETEVERREDERRRLHTAQSWLAFLALASLRAPFIPDAYAGAVALWLLALVASDARGLRRWWVACAAALLWIVPPSRLAIAGIEALRMALSLSAQLAFLVLAGSVAWSGQPRRSSDAPQRSAARPAQGQ